ncbi:MAG: ribonuclease, partial [Blastococcus sp.]|nr:ribonuclease [Blastococcus sp.]
MGAGSRAGVHTEPVSTVAPSGSPTRSGDAGSGPGTAGADGSARERPEASGGLEAPGPEDRPTGRLARWPAPVRVPLQVLGRTLAKAWHDRILGLSAEAAFWQILSVPPLLIGLLGSLGYLSSFIGAAAVR